MEDKDSLNTRTHLESRLSEWMSIGEPPNATGTLSGGQWRALALAARHPVKDNLETSCFSTLCTDDGCSRSLACSTSGTASHFVQFSTGSHAEPVVS